MSCNVEPDCPFSAKKIYLDAVQRVGDSISLLVTYDGFTWGNLRKVGWLDIN